MLDVWARRQIDPLLDGIAPLAARARIPANAITVGACLVGLAAGAAAAAGMFPVALALMLLSRLGDGLDGAVAAIEGRTDLGGYLDIVLDFFVYGALPLGFVVADPAANAVAGAVLLFSFYVNGASFLAYAVMAERRMLASATRNRKSLFFSAGLVEATETIAFFVAICLAPEWFAALAYVLAGLTVYTALSRIVLATKMFR